MTLTSRGRVVTAILAVPLTLAILGHAESGSNPANGEPTRNPHSPCTLEHPWAPCQSTGDFEPLIPANCLLPGWERRSFLHKDACYWSPQASGADPVR